MAKATHQPGSRLGAAIAEMLARTSVNVRRHTLPMEKAVGQQRVVELMEAAERELAPMARRIFEPVLQHPDVPDDIKSALRETLEPKRFVEAIVFAILIGAGLQPLAQALLEPFLVQLNQTMWGAHPVRVLSAEQVAQAVVAGHWDEDRAVTESHGTGVDRERLKALIDVFDRDPTVGEAMTALNRGLVDHGRFRELLKKAGVNQQWWDLFERLRFDIPSWQLVVQGDVQNQLSHEVARRKAAEAGLPPDDYEWVYGVAGDPIAIGQALELWNRGEMTEAQVEQVIRESRVKTKYIPQVKALARNYPPPRTVSALLRAGTIDEATGVRLFRYAGLPPDLAEAYTRAALAHRHGSTRDLAKSEVVSLYETRVVDRGHAGSMLRDLGYDDTESEMLLDLADARRDAARLNREIAAVRSRFVAHHLDRTDAALALDRLGVPATTRDDLLDEWEATREATVRTLTEAQLATALRRGLITAQEYRDRLVRMGYSPEDADLLVRLRGEGGGGA
jgi:hypothetical protein